MIYFILTFFLGVSIGSFVNVLIDRTMTGRDWVSGQSQCDFCKRNLAWYDMIPLLSFWYYGGKSRCCKKKLSLKHPLVEGLFGLLFVWWLAIGFAFFKLATAPLPVLQPVFWLGIGTILVILALTDLMYGVILMNLVWIGIVWVFLYRIVLVMFGAYRLQDFGLMLLAGSLAAMFIWSLRVATKGRGMGDGDPYLIFLTTLVLGWQRAGMGVLLAFIVGAIVGVGLMMSGVRKRNESVPFGPFIVGGAFIALVWGEQISRFLVLL